MKLRKMICALLLTALVLSFCAAQAAALDEIWMEYEDYSGVRAEQSVEDVADIKELEAILLRAKDNPAELDGCTMNCTLNCMDGDGNIYDFAVATDGCPFIQLRSNGAVYSLGDDYGRFWEILADVREGMGYDASDVFDW